MLAKALDGRPRIGDGPDVIDRVFGAEGWGRIFFPVAGVLLVDVLADVMEFHPYLELSSQAAFATIVFLIIHTTMTLRRERRAASPIHVAVSVMTRGAPRLSASPDSREDDLRRLPAFLRSTPSIAHRVLEDCDSIEPAVRWMTRAWLEDCTICDNGQTIFLPLEGEHPPAGAIILKDCLFLRCRFHNIGIAGPAEDLERFRERLTPARRRA